jgi:hypothetical protein
MRSGNFYIVHYYGTGNFGLKYGRNYGSIIIGHTGGDPSGRQSELEYKLEIVPILKCTGKSKSGLGNNGIHWRTIGMCCLY